MVPFDGVVAARYMGNNEHLKKFTQILALKDISEIEIVIQVPERLMAQGGITKTAPASKFYPGGGYWYFNGSRR